MHEFAEVRAQQFLFAAREDLAQRRVRLQHQTVVGDERHADRRVGERLLEAALALLQLGEVARGVGGFALGGGDTLLLRELGVLDVAHVQPVHEHHDAR